MMQSIANEYITPLDEKADGKTPINVVEQGQNLSAETVVRNFFSDNFSNRKINGKKIQKAVADMFGESSIYSRTSLFYKLKLMLCPRPLWKIVTNPTELKIL